MKKNVRNNSSQGKKPMPTEVYTEEEMAAVEDFIETNFGTYANVFHEVVSPDIHLDICIVDPTEERNYYMLVTLGMGAHRMNVPKELAEYKLERAELAIALPPDWKIHEDDEEYYWPIHLLKSLARLPIEDDTWLGWGHTIDSRTNNYAKSTKLTASLIIGAQVKGDNTVCTLPDGDEVNFYQIIPLYRDELNYKFDRSAKELVNLLGERHVSFVVDPQRSSACAPEDFEDLVMDNAEWHLSSLHEKKLPVDEIEAYSHMAVYLRWCILRDLMADWFIREYETTVRAVKEHPAETDLRPFLRDELHGILMRGFFNEEGAAFARYYYDGEAPSYPSDVDNHALAYFGAEKYYSKEFDDEAYLFVPFDEQLYREMAELIARHWDAWKRNTEEQVDATPSDVSIATMQYLNASRASCSLMYLPPLVDDDPIASWYSYATRTAARDGIVPVIIVPSDTLWEALTMNAEAEKGAFEDYEFNADAVIAYRERMAQKLVKDGKKILMTRRAERTEDMTVKESTMGDINDRPIGYWNYETQKTHPVILAKIPVKHPWEIFTYLPFGGWNDCPDTAAQMAVAKYWHKTDGAVPAVLTYDTLEYRVPAPVAPEHAAARAVEQYAYCSDIIEQGGPGMSISRLADSLRKSHIWYFWWD